VSLSRALRILGIGLLVVVVAAALTGCGSDDDSESSKGTTTSATTTSGTTTSGTSSPLDGWAQGFCTTVASWQGTVKTTQAKLSKSQADFASASEAITSANEILIDSLKGLGTPPAPASTQAKNAIDELSGDLEDGAAAVNTALTGNFSTQSEIAQASGQAKASLLTMKRDISTTVTKLRALPDAEGWKQAFQDVAACHAVANG
jgi:hypothetical protein